MKIQTTLIIVMVFLASVGMAQNISTTNVQNLSDSQITQIAQQIKSSGLSMDQAIALAKTKGASQTQIDQLISRIQQQNSLVSTPSHGVSIRSDSDSRPIYSTKAEIQVNPMAKKVFGFQLFNNKNLSFDPSINLPTPENYVLGAGDGVLINVWGASQQTYQLQIDKAGAIYIPSLGPIYIAGMNFDRASHLIKKRLTGIYGGMAKSNPTTWAVVSLSALRAIKVNITGEVNAPGTYRLPSTATVFNALYLSGGPNENGSFRTIKLIRNNKIIKTIDVYDFLISGSTAGNVQLRDQDVIFIPTYKERVQTAGDFKRNNYFELQKGETLKDLIRYAGGFTTLAYKSQLSIIRLTNKEKKVVDVNENNFDTFPLKNGDRIVAGAILDRYTNRVIINGAVYRPGTYELTPGMTLRNLIAKADGVKADVYSNRGLIIREKEDLTKEAIAFDVNDVLQHKTDIPLQKEDVVSINTISSMREARFINISGEVQKAGRYAYYDKMTVNDLIFLAGGFKEGASGSYVEIARRNSQQEASKPNTQIAHVFTIKIDKSLRLEDGKGSFVLQPFDYVHIRRAPSYFPQRNVDILGEVNYPGIFSITTKNERISDLIKRAGGLTKFAYAQGATLKREKEMGRAQEEKLKELALSSDSTLKIDSVQLAKVKQKNVLVELNLAKILRQPGCLEDYTLKEGDVINIPELKHTVRVIGAVMNPISLAYTSGQPAKYYIEKSGGFALNAKRSRIYIIYANGTTSTGGSNIQPGCQIVVPQRPKRHGDFMDSFVKVFSVLTSVLTTIVLVKRL